MKMLTPKFGAAWRQALTGVCLAVAAAGAYAQAWPSKPVRLIVPYAAGGFSDQAARAIGKALSDDLKQPVVIENRGGAGGRIGAEAVSRMTPDGYNLLLTTNGTHTYMAVTEKSLSYDPVNDFTPISQIASYGLLMVVNPSVPAKNVKEFIEYAKANPGKLSYASSGPGSGLHFAGEVFKSMTGVQMTHVPYKGSGPGLLDVIANVCQVIFAGEAKPHIDSGKVRLLGTTSARRDPRYPDVPTVAEGGLPGYDLTYWVALFGPKDLPADVRERLSVAIRNIMKDEALQKQFASMGLVPVGSTPEQLVSQIRTETSKLREVAVQSGIVSP
ncbi:tripartite tricarboxylate transporter substrate binding protein [Ramlibacter sp. AN1015]|uniref:Bug family tripartite tricarboxylate transporter substrate binding protein n=1 Tax=Ramlibacter sp. AN1015 TaxID=3133428 RepID=UPI0030C01DD7